MEVTTEKVEGTILKTTESNNQERSEAKHLFRQPRRTTLTKTIVGKKGVLNQNPTYHPSSRATMVRPRLKSKPEKEKTSRNKDAKTVLGSARKLGSDMSQIWPSTIKENWNKKSKKDARRIRPTIGSGRH